MIRHIARINLSDVASERVASTVGKIRVVGLDCVLVPFRRKDAFPTDQIEGLTDPADPGKKVNESERRRLLS